ncbi:hypothetical protein Btru_013944 [Bulinus truncatus]|nr:hypothetical protein Btru_013944 [Bulinus truncatus]
MATKASQETYVDNVCDVGDFCTFKCHCNQLCSTTNGHCPNNAKCDMGWFGLRCQYEDLVSKSGANVSTSPVLPYVDWLTDRDDITCNTDKRLQSITVTWDKSYPLTWLRITLSEPTMLSSIKIKYNSTNGDRECQSQRLFLLGDGTMDIRCYDMVVMQRLTILGNITSLCSLYVSGAVDGKTGGNLQEGSCSHTAVGDNSPHFVLILQSSYVVSRFILYNRDGEVSIRLKGFRLIALNSLNRTVFDYKDKYSVVQPVYYINMNVQQPIKSISVNETTEFGRYLTICEIEAYGECPEGRWSLPCTRQCNSSCSTSCHIDDGSCSSVCAGYSNPPDCSTACDVGKWGINCRNDCSKKCVNFLCDFKTGKCVQGCDGYSDPPYCTQECSRDTWGINCSRPCSQNCNTNKCDSNNGRCYQGCKAGYELPNCERACPSNKWGVNCSTNCNVNCYGSECNHKSGSCSTGCVDGFQLADCMKACEKGTYGLNCSRYCSSQCSNGECDAVTGFCFSCLSGFMGNTCDQEDSAVWRQFNNDFGAGFGAGAAAVILIGVVLAIVCVYCRRRIAPPSRSSHQHIYDQPASSAESKNVYETIQSSIDTKITKV